MTIESIERKQDWNLYYIQDSDRPMHILARSWQEAIEGWRSRIIVENPGVDCSNEQPEGVSLIAEAGNVIYPELAMDAPKNESDQITADHLADLYARAKEEGQKSRQKEIDDLRRQIKQLKQLGYPKIKPQEMVQSIDEVCDWLMIELGWHKININGITYAECFPEIYKKARRQVRVALGWVYRQACKNTRSASGPWFDEAGFKRLENAVNSWRN